MHEDGIAEAFSYSGVLPFSQIKQSNRRLHLRSTGEGVSLTMQEKKDTARAWADCTNDDPDFDVMLLLGGTCIADCIELAKYAQETDSCCILYSSLLLQAC